MSDREILELIERFHQHQVTSAERQMLEERVAADPVFAQRVREAKLFTDALQIHGRQLSLRERLNQQHQAWQQERTQPAPATAPVLRRRTPMQMFMRRYAATMGVAATVAIVTVFSSLLGMEMWRSANKQQTARYVELRREVDALKRKQNAIMSPNAPAPRATPSNPGQFSGTGFVLTSDGYFVTSYHVIEGADSLMIEKKDGTKYKVEEIYSDQLRDLALLRVTDTSFTGFGKLPYSFKQRESELGEKVFTLGYPREDVVFGEGTLSSRSGVYGDTASYQISIPLNPGNSGGPLLDDRGNLIGVISGKMLGVDGAAFAVKSAYLLTVLDQLPEHRLPKPISLPKVNTLAGTSRPQQLKKLQDYVYMVKVYN